MTEIGEEKMLHILKAFVRGFCTNDLATPLGPPVIEHLTLDLLSFRGAGQTLAQLINALPSLRSLRVGHADESRCGPGCLLDSGSLMVLANEAQEDEDEEIEFSEALANSEDATGSDDIGSAQTPSSVYVMEHGVLGDEWMPRGTMMLSGHGAGYEARLSDAKEFVQMKPQLQEMITKAAGEEKYYAIRMYNPASPKRTLQAAIPMKLLADHFEDWHDILEVSVSDAGIPVALSYRVKHTLGLMLFDHTQVHLSEPSRIEGPRVQAAVREADGSIKPAEQPQQQSLLRRYWWVIAIAAFSKLTFMEFEGARADSLSLAPLLSSARSLKILDLSHSEFGDVEAQLWAAARVGPLPLQCLGFRHCRLRTPAGAAAVARILNNLGQVKHLRIQANRWRVESHRAFAEQLSPCAAQGLHSLEAGYCTSVIQVPLTVMAADAPDIFRAAEAEFTPPSPNPPIRRLRISAGPVSREQRGETGPSEAASSTPAPAPERSGTASGTPFLLCSDRLNFLSHFGAGLWLAAALTRLGGLREIRLENLPLGLVAMQVLRRRLRTPLEHLKKLTLGKGCTGLKEQQAGQELAFALAKTSPALQCLDLAGSDATPAMLLGMVEAFSSPSTPHLDGLQSQAGPPPRLLSLNWIDVDEAYFPDCGSLLQAFWKSRGCLYLQGIRRHRDLLASGNWRLLAEAQQTA
eukprot:s103_g11.t2